MRKTAIIIAFLSLISAWIINQLNLSELRKDGVELRLNETVITADDASYISPAQNFVNSGKLKNNLKDKSAYFLRPPGYSCWLILHGGVQTSTQLFILKITQTLLFSMSVYFLFFIAFDFLNSKKLAAVVATIYGVSTIASGFLFYTLSEAITPALVIVFVYLLIRARKSTINNNKVIWYCFSSLIFSALFMTRPVLGVFILPLFVFLFADFSSKKNQLILVSSISGLIAFAPMGFWQIRNSKIAQQYVGLHPIYFNQHSSSCYRPTHQSLWELNKGWGEKGGNFHGYFGEFWTAGINGDTATLHRENFMSHIPNHVIQELGRKNINEMLIQYQVSILYQKEYYDAQLPMPMSLPKSEVETIKRIESLVNQYKRQLPFEYYFVSPLKVFKTLAFHSNLSLYLYQKTFRGNILMEAFRLFSYCLHALVFLLLIFSLFLKSNLDYKSLFSFTLIIYVGYLIFVQRGIEERYTLPVFALVLISTVRLVQQFSWRFRRKKGLIK